MTGQTTAVGGARVVTGEPGCGRTTFLNRAARSLPAASVVRTEAGPTASALPLDGLRALLHALGTPAGPWPPARPADAVLLDALRAASTSGPLLVCVDDAHLWDAPTRAALGAVAGRLSGTDRVGVLLSVAGHRPVDREFAALPVTRLDPLSPAEAAALLDEATGGAVDRAVRDDLVDAADGSPALLLAMVRRLTPAQLRGHRALPDPPTDAGILTGLVGGLLTGLTPAQADLLLTVAAALRDADDTEDAHIDPALARRAAEHLRATPPATETAHSSPLPSAPPHDELPEVLVRTDGGAGFRSSLLRRAVYAGAHPERRRAAHRALARALEEAGADGLDALLHRARGRSAAGPGRGAAAELAVAAGDPACPAPPMLRSAAYAHAAGLAEDGARRAAWYTAAAEQALLGGRTHRALRLLDRARDGTASPALRGRIELVRGTAVLYDGPVDEARGSLLLAARLLAAPAPGQAQTALSAAMAAAWAAGDAPGCLHALGAAGSGIPDAGSGIPDAGSGIPDAGSGIPDDGSGLSGAGSGDPDDGTGLPGAGSGLPDAGTGLPDDGTRPGARPFQGPPGVVSRATAPVREGRGGALHDYRTGVRALLEGRFPEAAEPLRRLVAASEGAQSAAGADEAEQALLAAAAALLLGDPAAARRAGARALAAARMPGSPSALARAREYLAYAALRAGRHTLARTHAEEGLRAAHRTGQRNTAAHHHAVLALAASIDGTPQEVAAHAAAALAVARRHGLVQAATLAEWAAGRADLGRGRPREAADRLGPLVRPGPRRGHFAVWMLAVPCFVEAAASTGRADEGVPEVVEEFARWAGFGADPQAPAHLMRCRALLAPADRPDALYRRALDLHDAAGGGDFEHARTGLLHGKWLRRRRRLSEARDRLGAALVGFERCGALAWAEQTRAELRAGGAAPGGGASTVGGLSALTPQQQRIARCVAEGATNREVALTLSVSTRTVDYHLRKVFATLGVRSRVELVRMVEKAGQEG
ncbi:LuxR C-terminal-related transcriptional regulator [Streptomyces sp. NBC_00377]|uniref:LuxR C-terminal-related transcriptional regulator n=1 Tax=unclassified Streptomyces TaxID=2593676 RepID=UPI002E1EC67C|nr:MULTISPECIES: LuxR C-terminal-related transcriptional regulator [unclassified Streptomyces]